MNASREIPPIRIRALKLVGPKHEYLIDFNSGPASTAQQLSIIAGEISTGKTTILEFIDYCLGAKHHPEHDEVLDNVRTAQLAIEVREIAEVESSGDGGSILVRASPYVIERPLGDSNTRAWLYRGGHDDLSESPIQSFTTDPADPESLSQYLLQICGLGGVRLKDAPTQEESDTSILSFRDVQPLWFLTNRRMDNADLVLEKNPHKSLKLRQVVDYFFGVNDGDTSVIAGQIDELRKELNTARSTLGGLRSFLSDAGIQDLAVVDNEADKIRVELADARAQVRAIDLRLSASTQFAANARESFHAAAQHAREAEAKLRERETLVKRLDPLRSQYADDIRKLELLQESRRLFDSLSVTNCPACQSELPPVHMVDGTCSLCRSTVSTHTGHDTPSSLSPDEEDGAREDESTTVDEAFLARERWGLGRRLDQLKRFAAEVRAEADTARGELEKAEIAVREAQVALDASTSAIIAPFVAERDVLTTRASTLESSLAGLSRTRRLLLQLQQRENHVFQTDAALKDAIGRLRALEQTQQSRDVLLATLGARFEDTLKAFGYPKVSGVRLQKNLVPVVRNRRYDLVGSSGAMTLIALAWQLSIFELAIEVGGGHPGFMLIDSPQKNLRPVSNREASTGSDEAEIAANHASIVERVYAHIESWLAAHPEAQIIIVDNEPPDRADESVVVTYSADPDQPPYGLIHNADGRDASALTTPKSVS
ncbi:ATP-binding protein [Diaminobutyricimonas sp. LJ205]|uniref:ATP-binding protein n=1 Tax=Diaminobutyricimonas sp. LJ205 TaxID=2683590 RepID=UPI0012F48E4D|nr:ATP-binding protein [Diaminobutyricimonas sp. LJ205]